MKLYSREEGSSFGAQLMRPYLAGALLPVLSAVLMLAVLPFSHFNRPSLFQLLAIAATALVAGLVLLVGGKRLPDWSAIVDALLGDVLVSWLCLIQPRADVPFSTFYIWTSVLVALYFRPLIAIAHLCLVGAGYALVLLSGPTTLNPVSHWLVVVGSTTILSAITLGLIRVLRRNSVLDPLTGLANRRAWDIRLDEELERARRNHTALSLLMIDVDNFKSVNDSKGHMAGDRLLRQLADSWSETVREGGDFLARLGGDEFGILAPGTNESQCPRLAKRIRAVVPIGASCSAGAATWNSVETAGELYRRADEEMYRVKRLYRRTLPSNGVVS